jgi:hypothetical protein
MIQRRLPHVDVFVVDDRIRTGVLAGDLIAEDVEGSRTRSDVHKPDGAAPHNAEKETQQPPFLDSPFDVYIRCFNLILATTQPLLLH